MIESGEENSEKYREDKAIDMGVALDSGDAGMYSLL